MPRVVQRTNNTQDIQSIEEGLDSIINRNECKHEFNTLYESANKIVTSNTSDGLNKLQNLLSTKIEAVMKGWVTQLEKENSNPLLSLYSSMYDNFLIFSNIIPKIYRFYDDNSRPENKSEQIIRNFYSNFIIGSKAIMPHVVDSLIIQINSFRDNPTDTNYKVPKNIVDSFYNFRNVAFRGGGILNEFIEDFKTAIFEYFDTSFAEKRNGDMVAYTADSQTALKTEENIISAIFRQEHFDEVFGESFRCFFDFEEIYNIANSCNLSPLLDCDNVELLKWLVSLMHKYFSNHVQPLVELLCQSINNRMLSFKPQFDDSAPKAEKAEKTEKAEEGENAEDAPAAPKKKVVKKKAVIKKKTVVKKETEDKEEKDDEEKDDEEKDDEEKDDKPKKRVVKKATPKAAAAATPSEKPAKSKLGRDEKINAMKDLILTTYKLHNNFREVFKESKDRKLMHDSIEKAWNIEAFKPQVNLVHFIHFSINNNIENLPENQRKDFAKIVRLFYEFTSDKAIFIPLFKNYQIQRIIKNRDSEQVSRQLEFEVVKEIKSVPATSNAEGFGKHLDDIYTQVKISIDTTKNFILTLPKDEENPEFIGTVLNHNIVQQFATSTFKIMPFLAGISDKFTEFYKKNHANSDLKIIPDISQLQFTLRIPRNKKCKDPKVYSLNTDVWGGSILMAIYEAKDAGLKGADINAITGIQAGYVEAYLNMMYHMKLIAIKEKTATNKMDSIEWIMNKNFYNMQRAINIPTVDIQKDKASDIASARKQQLITIHICRIGKANKQTGIAKSKLIEEVIASCSKYFKPTMQEINKRMEELAQVNSQEHFIDIYEDGTIKYVK